MNGETRALRHEVCHVPAPKGMDYEKKGFVFNDGETGTSGNQFKNAPIVGEMMAALITACEAGHDHDDDPLSFHLRCVERTVSLGLYSRRREIDRDSSFSVLG
jgi:hypothetical protein